MPAIPLVSPDLNLAVTAYLARYKDQTRIHADSDLRCFLTWCARTGLEPMQARRVDLELFLRWMQLQRHYKPSTVSRRLSIVAGFYRTRSSTACSPSHPQSTCADLASRQSHPRWGSRTSSSRHC